MNYFPDCGFFSHDILNLSAIEAYRLCETDAYVVDVRESYLVNFRMLRVKNLICIPYSTLKDSFHHLPMDIPLIFAEEIYNTRLTGLYEKIKP